MAGTGEGVLVALNLPPGEGFASAVERVWADGDAVLPLDPRAPRTAVGELLGRLRPAAVIEASGRTALPGAVPVVPGTAAVITTSGTSGPPKGVVLSHAAMTAAAAATAARLRADERDRWLCCLPLHHIAGFQILVRGREAGRPPIIHRGFEPALVAAEREASLVSLVPAMLERLLAARVNLARWRAVLLGGGPIPGGLRARAAAAGARVITTYGMTETCGGVVYDGRPLDGVDVQAGADGRIRIRGPMLMDGYRCNPAATGEAMRAGWFVTSDRGEVTAGQLTVAGRIDDVIITGGKKVSAARVEKILRDHPLVAGVLVIGRPDAEWGERVVAIVVASERGVPGLADVRAFVAERLPSYMAPRELEIADAVDSPGSRGPG